MPRQEAINSNLQSERQGKNTNDERKIVVSLKKLTNKISTDRDLENLTIPKDGRHGGCTLSNAIEETGNYKGQEIFIDLIEKYYDKELKSKLKNWGTVYCMVPFVFSKSSKALKDVYFSDKNKVLLGKVRTRTGKLDKSMLNLFAQAAKIEDKEWDAIQKLGLTAEKTEIDKRQLEKQLKKQQDDNPTIIKKIKAATIGRHKLLPETIKLMKQLNRRVHGYDYCSLHSTDTNEDGTPVILSCDSQRFLDDLKKCIASEPHLKSFYRTEIQKVAKLERLYTKTTDLKSSMNCKLNNYNTNFTTQLCDAITEIHDQLKKIDQDQEEILNNCLSAVQGQNDMLEPLITNLKTYTDKYSTKETDLSRIIEILNSLKDLVKKPDTKKEALDCLNKIQDLDTITPWKSYAARRLQQTLINTYNLT